MNSWNVNPLISVGDIKFGMKRSEVRNVIKGDYKVFKKTKFSKNTSDNFGFCHVFYNGSDECEAIEIFEEINVLIDGTKIFPAKISDVRNFIQDLIEEDGSYISESVSIGIHAPTDEIESILFGNEGYY